MASQELYSKLRVYDEVVGVSVCKKKNIKYIVVHLTKLSGIILDKIPNIYKGNNVETELTGNIYLQ